MKIMEMNSRGKWQDMLGCKLLQYRIKGLRGMVMTFGWK